MEVTARQLRDLQKLLPEEKRSKFRQVFPQAFEKKDVTEEVAIKAVKSSGCRNTYLLKVYVNQGEKTEEHIMDLNLKDSYSWNSNYMLETEHDGKWFRIVKLAE